MKADTPGAYPWPMRTALPAGSSRAKVTSANARWISAAEERDRLEALLTPEDRVAVGLLP